MWRIPPKIPQEIPREDNRISLELSKKVEHMNNKMRRSNINSEVTENRQLQHDDTYVHDLERSVESLSASLKHIMNENIKLKEENKKL